MTRYLVLQQAGVSAWKLFGVHVAHDADGAIRSACAHNYDAGTYVAVPERSWKPLRVAIEHHRRLRLDAVSEREANLIKETE